MYQPLLYSILILRCPPPLYDQYHAMASSTPTTSIPIQEPVFQQFVHDVHIPQAARTWDRQTGGEQDQGRPNGLSQLDVTFGIFLSVHVFG